METQLAARLLGWYAEHARSLPWRDHPHAYDVWVSEIMLQQTRVDTVIPYFLRWMERFPTVQALASAQIQEVLSLWEGLGYYSRARNLHRAAQIVVHNLGGTLPEDVDGLISLPGIGRYTAGAIASLAFGRNEPALDGNIRRVLARVFNMNMPDRSPEGERRLWALARDHLPSGQAGSFNQALMDLGAMICTPRNPDCPACPLHPICQAFALGNQLERPVRQPKPAVPHHIVTAAVLRRGGQVLIARRPEKGLLGGLWEFPGGKVHSGEALEDALRREILEELAAEINVGMHLGVYEHAFTHFRITLHAFECHLASRQEPQALEHSALLWVQVTALKDYPMGKVDRLIARRLMENGHNHS